MGERDATIRVLAIEDSRSDEVLFRWAIERHKLPYSCTFANNLEQAKQALAQQNFDVVLCDFYLGTYTAFDIFPLVQGTPIVIVTAADEHDVAVSAMKAGAYDYLVKDFQGRYLQKLPLVIKNAIHTKQVNEEKKALEQQLYQRQKLEAIGVLAGGIAHDFNNILGSILGFSEMVAQDLRKHEVPELTQDNVQQVILAANRAKNLVEQILTFSRPAEEKPAEIAIDGVIDEVAKLVRASTPSSVALHVRNAAPQAVIYADATRVHQLLLNLCTNAAHAIGNCGAGTGKITLAAELAENTPADWPAKHCVKLTVQDDGCGMSAAIRERIFEPFFTTKQVGEGTGMGLSIVHGIVRNLGGDIEVLSEEGKGTTFVISLPCGLQQTPVNHANGKAAQPVPGLQQGKILFVDDEEALVEVGKMMLSRMGFDVVGSQSSAEALELFQQNPQDFDLVITDQTMPQLAGDELGKKLLALRPDLPIIICTGYSEMLTPEIAEALGFREQLSKPVSFEVLREAIAKATA